MQHMWHATAQYTEPGHTGKSRAGEPDSLVHAYACDGTGDLTDISVPCAFNINHRSAGSPHSLAFSVILTLPAFRDGFSSRVACC